MTPILPVCSWMSSDMERSVSNLTHSAGNALPRIRYVWFWFKHKLPPSSVGGTHRITSSVTYSLSLCTEVKFCTLAITARETSQLLQLITCSDGVTDTWCCRSVALTVLLRGHLQPMKDFWMALDHFPTWNIFWPGLWTHLSIQEDERIHY